MRMIRGGLAIGAAVALTVAIGATEALAKKGGRGGPGWASGGPGWAGGMPPGFGQGRKLGWDDGRPPGWSNTRGKKKGWRNRNVPPGWVR